MNKRTCNVEKCNTASSALGMCNLHYQRKLSGRPLMQPPKAQYETCTAGECDKAPRSKYATLCPMHYHRLYRYGTLEATRVLVSRGEREPSFPRADLTGQRFGTLVAKKPEGNYWFCACDCGQARMVSIGELRRTGDKNTCGTKANHLSDDVDYTAVHSRVRNLHGSASEHSCIDCGTRAYHWSYDHADPDERLSAAPRTLGIAFSLDPSHYQPRCVPCHKRFDLARINATEVYG